MAMQYLRFADLQDRNIVPNRTTLKRWQDQLDFPQGILLSDRIRVWPDDEVDAWIESRRQNQQEKAA